MTPLDTVPSPTLATTRDGRWLHYEAAGSGSPTVVFESGMGGSRLCWARVAPTVAESARTVVYDRSGLGRSPRDLAPRTLARMADDLEDLLAEVADGPIVLVGHSYGGPITRTVLARRPEGIVGLVLVDPTDEACPLYFDPKLMRQQTLLGRLLPTLSRLGLTRWAMGRTVAGWPEADRRAFLDEDTSVASARAMQAEMVPILPDLTDLRDRDLPPIDVPFTTISGGRVGRFDKATRGLLVASHEARAAAAPHGRHVTAARSGHMVPFSEPDLIATEIVAIVDQVR
jgi:pimeloyl-ACP methyl ester carboxylesterase